MDLLCEDARCQLIVPLSGLLRSKLELSEAEELSVEADVGHPGTTLLLRHSWVQLLGVKVGLIVRPRIVELRPLDPCDVWTLSTHLVKFAQHVLGHVNLLLVEGLHGGLDLLHGVQLQPLLVDRVHQLVHPVEEDANILLDLLVAEQVLEVVIGVVALLLLVHRQAGCVAILDRLLALSFGGALARGDLFVD